MPDAQRIHNYRGVVGFARLDESLGEGDRIGRCAPWRRLNFENSHFATPGVRTPCGVRATFDAARAALSITSATSFGCET